MVKLVMSCPVCGGRGKFLNIICEKCKGLGGKLIPFDERSFLLIEASWNSLSAQERAAFDLYRKHLSQGEIAKRMDISKTSVIFLLRKIEKRMNVKNEKIN